MSRAYYLSRSQPGRSRVPFPIDRGHHQVCTLGFFGHQQGMTSGCNPGTRRKVRSDSSYRIEKVEAVRGKDEHVKSTEVAKRVPRHEMGNVRFFYDARVFDGFVDPGRHAVAFENECSDATAHQFFHADQWDIG